MTNKPRRKQRKSKDPRIVHQQIHDWMKTEMREKGAQKAELRRTKRRLVLKKGLPSLPSFAMHTDRGLPYAVVLYWQPVAKLREIRIYYFDAQAVCQLAKTFTNHHDLEALAKEIKARTKMVSRYPPRKKQITVMDQTTEFNRRFQRVWDTIVKKFHLPHPKKLRKQRPMVRIQADTDTAPFLTGYDDQFIYFGPKNPHLPHIFTLYSLFFLLPSAVRTCKPVSMLFALSLLQRLKPYQEDTIRPALANQTHLDYYRQFQSYSDHKLQRFFRSLFVIADYNEENWRISSFYSALSMVSRRGDVLHKKDLPRFFLNLYDVTAQRTFLYLSAILGFQAEIRPDTDLLDPSEPTDQILLAVNDSNYNLALTALHSTPEIFGEKSRKILLEYIHSAIPESLEGNQISLSHITVRNSSDLEITIHEMTKTSQAHPEHISLQQKALILPPHSQSEPLLAHPVTRSDRVHLHYHFNATTNHKAVRSLQGTTHVEIK